MFVVIHFWENTFVVQTFCSRVSSRVRLEVLRSEWGAMVRGTHDVYVKCSQNNHSSRLSLVWEFFWGHSSGSSECRSFCGMKSIWGQTIYTPTPPPPPPSPQRVNWEHWPRNTMQRAFKFVCKPLKWRLNVACLTLQLVVFSFPFFECLILIWLWYSRVHRRFLSNDICYHYYYSEFYVCTC